MLPIRQSPQCSPSKADRQDRPNPLHVLMQIASKPANDSLGTMLRVVSTPEPAEPRSVDPDKLVGLLNRFTLVTDRLKSFAVARTPVLSSGRSLS